MPFLKSGARGGAAISGTGGGGAIGGGEEQLARAIEIAQRAAGILISSPGLF